MKKIIISLLTFVIVLFVIFFFSSNPYQKTIFLSPLPDVATKIRPTVTPLIKPTFLPHKANITFKPLVLGVSKESTDLNFSAQSVVAVDLTTGRTLITKNERDRRQIASLTKVMTAIVALEHSSLNDLITINEEAPKIGESMIGLKAGEKLTVKELLYGMLLTSANDAAESLAYGLTNADRQLFINFMNKKVKELKLIETYFANPTGLDEDGNKQSTYSSAADLLIITKYALENFPDFRQIVKTQNITFDANYRRKEYILTNQINLTDGIKGIEGVKAGFTDEAGYCLITLAKRDGHEVLGVILGSLDTPKDAQTLYDYSFKKISAVGFSPSN